MQAEMRGHTRSVACVNQHQIGSALRTFELRLDIPKGHCLRELFQSVGLLEEINSDAREPRRQPEQ